MNEHETRVWSELMKLPMSMLRVMADHAALSAYMRMGYPPLREDASVDDYARFLAHYLARRDFLR